jgi:rod shape-determining protein MreD
MTVVRAILLTLLAVMLQTLAVPLYSLREVVPRLVFLIVSYATLFCSRREAVTTAVAAGVVVDTLSLNPWGIHLAGLLLADHFLSLGRAAGWADHVLPRTLLLTAVAVLFFSLDAALVWTLGDVVPRVDLYALSMAYTVLLSLPCFHLLEAVFRLPERRTLV